MMTAWHHACSIGRNGELRAPAAGTAMTAQYGRGPVVSGPTFRVLHGSRASARGRASFGPVADIIGRVADTDVPVLLRGERGTGKALVARAIHDASSRREKPLVKIDCAGPLQRSRSRCSAVSAAPVRAPRQTGVRASRDLVPGPRQRARAVAAIAPAARLGRGRIHPSRHPRPVRIDVRLIAASERDSERLVPTDVTSRVCSSG